ncbi:MAG: hypothetical protein KBG00_07915 [Rhodoferax sp.]|uniref:hypothetical protein n=1 Tax=Rhodoferax sp. TaxID=50421 RepID=UPI001B537ED8|nr:hypothetical protein [Rhodoferax sp.]MBP9148694.1 hypothetical protein [Rhodoferax sp.]MBP9736272.1 hypothetical protein [Rhodoferax sp.]
MKTLFALMLAAMLAGCATPKHNYTPETKEFSEPAIGSISVANVGDKMLSQGVSVSQDVIEIRDSFPIGLSYIVGSGVYTKTGDDDEAEYFFPRLVVGGKITRTSIIFDLPSSLMLKKDGALCVITITSQYVCSKDTPAIERKKVDHITERTFQQTLIYSGKSGNKINIGYREFTSDMARMAFNNNVEYDLSESNNIGYKGAEIEIIEATNRLIKYRLIRNFNTSVR